ncbi:hypothetical protein BU16DRAFT_223782 [Lophium mytilinum]|uniref:Uncharacterized protein n=1 Tax=Lophium mytilinum TaxID=390894 RepID=A0A6A6Q8A9_9PEZI|nr:hypothetical protein BU16DRAFT_223782 [Lophium mytilinum]
MYPPQRFYRSHRTCKHPRHSNRHFGQNGKNIQFPDTYPRDIPSASCSFHKPRSALQPISLEKNKPRLFLQNQAGRRQQPAGLENIEPLPLCAAKMATYSKQHAAAIHNATEAAIYRLPDEILLIIGVYLSTVSNFVLHQTSQHVFAPPPGFFPLKEFDPETLLLEITLSAQQSIRMLRSSLPTLHR